MLQKNKNSNIIGFTLIELLVVVAIIGILSGVVLASLNSARDKGKIAAIKSTLKNMQSQAEITYNETGSYASTYNATTYDCIGPLANMAQSLTDKGVIVKCYSRNDSSRNDVYLRFGATAIIYDVNVFKAWSVDQNGVVKWDTLGVNSTGVSVTPDTKVGMTFNVSNTACATSGGRLPTIEQLFTLSKAYYYADTGRTNPYAPINFITTDYYWSSTVIPSTPSQAYLVYMTNGGIATSGIGSGYYTRCVR